MQNFIPSCLTDVLEREIVKHATKSLLLSRTQFPRTQTVRHPPPDPVQNEASGKSRGEAVVIIEMMDP